MFRVASAIRRAAHGASFAFEVAAAWTAAFLLSRLTDFSGTGYAAFTLPVGVAVVFAMRFPKRPLGVLGGVLLSNLVMALVVSRPLTSPVIAALINGGGALLIAYLWRRLGSTRLEQPRDVFTLFLASIGGSTAAALTAALSLGTIEGRNLPEMWWSWLSADVLGVLLVVPMLDILSLKRMPKRTLLTLLGAALLAGTFGSIAAFIASPAVTTSNVFLHFIPWYGLLLLILLVGVEFGALGVGLTQFPAALAIFAAQSTMEADPWLQRVALTVLFSVSVQSVVLAVRSQVTQRHISEDVASALFELSPEATAQVLVSPSTPDSAMTIRIVKANKAMRSQLSATLRELKNVDLTELFEPEDVDVVRSALRNPGQAVEVRLNSRRRQDDRIVRLNATSVYAAEHDESTLILSLRDITEHRRTVDRLTAQARRDALTGLLNRRAFVEEFEAMLAVEPLGRVGLLFIDVDRLKAINDERGHRAGDLVLRATAMRIERSLRIGDVAGRYGGDEFLVAVRVTDEFTLDALRTRIEITLAEPLVTDAIDIAMGCSVGAALASAGDDLESLLLQADAEMYARKALRKSDWNQWE